MANAPDKRPRSNDGSAPNESSDVKAKNPLSRPANNSGEDPQQEQPQSLGVRTKTNEPRTIDSPAGEPYNEDVRR